MDRMCKTLVLLLLVVLAGCGSKASCPKGTVDRDGRCVDATADANVDEDAAPGDACVGDGCAPKCVTETCNDKDDDCDGLVDEGVQTLGPMQQVGTPDAMLFGLSPWRDGFVGLLVNIGSVDKTAKFLEISRKGVPSAPRNLFAIATANVVSRVSGDVMVIADYTTSDPIRVRITTYDLVEHKVLETKTHAGQFLACTINGTGDAATVALATRTGTESAVVTKYTLQGLNVAGTEAFATSLDAKYPTFLDGSGDSTLYSVVDGTLVGFVPGGSVVSHSIPSLNIGFANLAVTDTRVAVAHSDFIGLAVGMGLDVYDRDLVPVGTATIRPSDGASGPPSFNVVTSSQDGTWYIAHDDDTDPDPDTRVHRLRLLRLQEDGDGFDKLLDQLVPCDAASCTMEQTATTILTSITANGNRVLVGQTIGSPFLSYVTPLGCF